MNRCSSYFAPTTAVSIWYPWILTLNELIVFRRNQLLFLFYLFLYLSIYVSIYLSSYLFIYLYISFLFIYKKKVISVVSLVLDITFVFAGRQPDDFCRLYAYQLLPHSTSLVFYWNVGLEQWKAYFLVSMNRGQQNVV